MTRSTGGEMDIIASRNGRTGVLALCGRLDTASAPGLLPRAIAQCDTGIGTLLIDLQQIDYLNSAGFWALIAAKRRAEQVSIAIVLCGLNDIVHDLFKVSGLLGSFRIYPDSAAALVAVARPDST
jgi:anti-sigma B factor antagonist